jgi:hypothetical protein
MPLPRLRNAIAELGRSSSSARTPAAAQAALLATCRRLPCVPARNRRSHPPCTGRRLIRTGLLHMLCSAPCLMGCCTLCSACRDLDVLRVQLLTEVEAPFKAKCDRLAKVRQQQQSRLSAAGASCSRSSSRQHASPVAGRHMEGKQQLTVGVGCGLHLSWYETAGWLTLSPLPVSAAGMRTCHSPRDSDPACLLLAAGGGDSPGAVCANAARV